jgi:hypothetical protein
MRSCWFDDGSELGRNEASNVFGCELLRSVTGTAKK